MSARTALVRCRQGSRTLGRLVLVAAALLLGASSASAQPVYNWNTPAGGNWGTGSNWDTGTAPTSSSPAHLVFGTLNAGAIASNGSLSGLIVAQLQGNGTVDQVIGGQYVQLGHSSFPGIFPVISNTNTGGFEVANGILIDSNTLTVTGTPGSGQILVSGIVGGGAGITVSGSAALTLSSANAYTGVTTLSGGVLTIGSIANGGADSPIGKSGSASSNLVFDGGTLRYTGSGAGVTDRGFTVGVGGGTIDYGVTGAGNRLVFNGSLDGSGTLTKTGAGWLALGGANNLSGQINVQGGRLGNDGLTASWNGSGGIFASVAVSGGAELDLRGQNVRLSGLSGSGNVINSYGNGLTNTLIVGENNASSTFTGVISGSGSGASGEGNGFTNLTKVGTGTLTLTGLSTYTGVTTLQGGVLSINGIAYGGVASPLGASGTASSNLVFNGGTLRYTGTGGGVTDRGFTVGAGGGTIDYGVTGSLLGFAGGLDGSATLNKTGAGWLAVLGANNLSGQINVQGGRFGNDNLSASWNGSGGVYASVALSSGTELDLRGQNVRLGGLSGSGNVINSYGNGLTNTLIVGENNASSTFTGVISGSGSGASGEGNGFTNLTKVGTGTLTLGGTVDNTFTGLTVINGGRIAIANPGSLQMSTVTLNAADGLQLLGGATVRLGALQGAQNQDLNGTSLSIGYNNLDSSYSGSFTNGGSASITKVGTGTLTLGGSNSYSGGTNINGGMLAIGSPSAIGGSGAALNFDGGVLRATANLTIVNSGTTTLNAGGGTFDTNGFTVAHNRVITGSGALTKSGSGTLSLSFGITNTYQGGTVINGGTLQIYDGAQLGLSTSGITLNGGTLVASNGLGTNSRTITVGAGGGTLVLNQNTPFQGTFAGTGDLTITGSNPVSMIGSPLPSNTLTGTVTVTGSGTVLTLNRTPHSQPIQGALIIQNSGKVVLGQDGQIKPTSSATIQSNGTLDLNAKAQELFNITMNGGTIQGGNLILSNTLTNTGGASTISSNIFMDGTRTFDITSGTLTTTGVVQNNNVQGGVNKTGLGTLVLGGFGNNYGGGTTISGGLLLANADFTSTGTGAVTVQSGGTLGGTGHVGSAVTVQSGGTLRAGDAGAVGTLQLNNGLTLNSGATLSVRIDQVGGAGAPSSGASTVGTLPNPTSNNFLNITGGATSINSGTMILIDGAGTAFTPGTQYSYQIAQGAGNQSGLNITNQSQFSTINFSNAGDFTFSLTGNSSGAVFINFTPVPEPATVLGLCVGALALVRLVRRRPAGVSPAVGA